MCKLIGYHSIGSVLSSSEALWLLATSHRIPITPENLYITLQ